MAKAGEQREQEEEREGVEAPRRAGRARPACRAWRCASVRADLVGKQLNDRNRPDAAVAFASVAVRRAIVAGAA